MCVCVHVRTERQVMKFGLVMREYVFSADVFPGK